MGEFAKGKINEIITKLKDNIEYDDSSKKRILNIINSIGENLLRNSLLELYRKKFEEKSYNELLDFYNSTK